MKLAKFNNYEAALIVLALRQYAVNQYTQIVDEAKEGIYENRQTLTQRGQTAEAIADRLQ